MTIVSDLIYDVGLHRGEDTALYLAQGYRVIAFDANAANCVHCRERFAEELASGQLTIVEGAIVDDDVESVVFYLHPQHSEWGTTDAEWVERNSVHGQSQAVTVPAVNFTHWLEKSGMPFFMKVDIEGADRVCFEALRTFTDRPHYVSLESNKTDWNELLEEFTLLESLGYNSFSVVQQQRRKNTPKRVTSLAGAQFTYRLEPSSSGSFAQDLKRWETRESALARYCNIFRLYRMFGDRSILRRYTLWRCAVRLLPFPLPGWYDTHARHRDAEKF